MGRLPLHLLRKLLILTYWIKLRRTENCILKECFESRVNSNDDWIFSIKAELNKLGLSYLWDCDLSDKHVFSITKQRFYDVQKQEMLGDIGNAAKGELYQHLIDNFCIQYYLVKPIPNMYKKCIARYRENFEKMMQNGAIWGAHKVFLNSLKLSCILVTKIAFKMIHYIVSD